MSGSFWWAAGYAVRIYEGEQKVLDPQLAREGEIIRLQNTVAAQNDALAAWQREVNNLTNQKNLLVALLAECQQFIPPHIILYDRVRLAVKLA